MRHMLDSEERQQRAIDAMEALEELLVSQAEGACVQTAQIGALIGLVFDANRQALPKAVRMGFANDADN